MWSTAQADILSNKSGGSQFSVDTAHVNDLLIFSQDVYEMDSISPVIQAVQSTSALQEALALSDSIGYTLGVAGAYRYMGLDNYYLSQYESAFLNWNRSLEAYDQIGDSANVARLLSNLGAVYNAEGNEEKALEYYLNSQKYAEAVKDTARLISAFNNIGALYGFHPQTYDDAIMFYHKSLDLAELYHDKQDKGTASANLAEIYMAKKDNHLRNRADSSLYLSIVESGLPDTTVRPNVLEAIRLDSLSLLYFRQALDLLGGTDSEAFILTGLGKLYMNRGEYDAAIKSQSRALQIASESNRKTDIVEAMLNLAETYKQIGEEHNRLKRSAEKKGNYQKAASYAKVSSTNFAQAKVYFKDALSMTKDEDGKDDESLIEAIVHINLGLSEIYKEEDEFELAFIYQEALRKKSDTLRSIEGRQKLKGATFQYDIDKQQDEIKLLNVQKELQEAEIKNERLVKNISLVGLASILAISFILFKMYRNKVKTNKLLDAQRVQIKNLLLNTLPADVVKELEDHGRSMPKSFESVSVLFTDFKGFTKLAANLSPIELIEELTTFFTAFDDIMGKYGIEKIKTIGDAYMCAGGVPNPLEDHAKMTVLAGLEIQSYMNGVNIERRSKGLPPWELRVGIHTGPVVAGVVGKKKYAYDIWGDAVNTASRMESNGAPGKVNVSLHTYELVKDHFDCEHRGKIEAKNLGEIDMYFVDHLGTQNLQETETATNQRSI